MDDNSRDLSKTRVYDNFDLKIEIKVVFHFEIYLTLIQSTLKVIAIG